MKINKFYFFYVSPKEGSLTLASWAFRLFNLNFKNSKYGFYNERGFRLFGLTFLWANR